MEFPSPLPPPPSEPVSGQEDETQPEPVSLDPETDDERSAP